MICIKKPIILLSIIFSLFLYPVKSQTVDETLVFADKQFNLKNYNLALKEYRRVLFFSDKQNLSDLYRRIAKLYFVQSNFLQAAHNYELAYKTSNNDSLKITFIFKKASCYILDYKFRMATFELMNLPDSTDRIYTNRKNFYFAVCYWGLEEFDMAQAYFMRIIPENCHGDKEKIAMLFSEKKNLYRPNPKTAKIMSQILPGSGQIYAGDFKNGINSLLLTGSFAFLGVYMSEYYSFFDAFLTSFTWFLRYYQGGYKKAEQIATHKRNKRRNSTYKEILRIIKKNIYVH